MLLFECGLLQQLLRIWLTLNLLFGVCYMIDLNFLSFTWELTKYMSTPTLGTKLYIKGDVMIRSQTLFHQNGRQI